MMYVYELVAYKYRIYVDWSILRVSILLKMFPRLTVRPHGPVPGFQVPSAPQRVYILELLFNTTQRFHFLTSEYSVKLHIGLILTAALISAKLGYHASPNCSLMGVLTMEVDEDHGLRA